MTNNAIETQANIDEIKARREAIQPADDWDLLPATPEHKGEYVDVDNDSGTVIARIFNTNDAEFIANAPRDIDGLLEELERYKTAALSAIDSLEGIKVLCGESMAVTIFADLGILSLRKISGE